MVKTNLDEFHIILLRHGESVGNAEGYHQGQSDFPLTETGYAQAKALAAHWIAKGVVFDKVIASPQSRAKQTAEIIANALGYEIEYDPIWMERDNGVLAGLHHDVAREKYPPKNFIPLYEPIGLTGESQWELFLRAGLAIQSILSQPPGPYLIVSHGGLLNMVLKAALGIIPQANFQGPRFRFQNTAYASITYFPEIHTWHVNSLNARPHWDHP